MADFTNETMHFRVGREKNKASEVIMQVYAAMEEKGYESLDDFRGKLQYITD